MNWQNQFRDRINDFEKSFGDGKGVSISIKLRANSCFCREHCAKEEYKIIDKEVSAFDCNEEHAVLIEHESGPEILAYILLSAGVVSLSAAIIDVVTAVINSRKKNKSDSSFEIIIRNFDSEGNIREEKILKTEGTIDNKSIKVLLEKGIQILLKNDNNNTIKKI